MQPKIFSADEHDIDPSHIDADAITILKKLTEAGHIAYLVGGGVRDLLVNKRPKDFDISTSASPEEIKRIFQRNCLLIGRRFRLAHVRFGQKVIEVSTFRSGESSDELIVRDNQWGTPEQDVKRRDFTINGLFLDPTHHQVIDYVGGWGEDIHRGILRTIGDPVMRFRQDPVRMIRLLKFSARFPFQIDPTTYQALVDCKREILKSSPARVLEELLRMLESGSSKLFFEQMLNTGLLELLLPWLAKFLTGPAGQQVYTLLEAADEWTRQQGSLDRAVVSACLLYPILDRELRIQFPNQAAPATMGDISVVSQALIRGVGMNSFPSFTKRLKWSWAFILTTQYRLESLKSQPRSRLLRHPDFPLALSLLQFRTTLDPALKPLVEEWTALNHQHRVGSGTEVRSEKPHQSRRKPSYRNRPPSHHHPAHGH